MSITQDTFGNFFEGNYIAGSNFTYVDLLALIRTALGSNDRANLNSSRIDWRPNIGAETLTGVVGTPPYFYISTGDSLATNARLGFSFFGGNAISNFGTSVANQPFFNNGDLLGNADSGIFWACCTESNINLFVQKSGVNFFYSQGVLQNSPLTFPNNLYFFGENLQTPYIQAGASTPIYKDISVTSTRANYIHTKNSDNTTTTSEVELYLRDASTGIPYGYIPNVFKWKIDAETSPSIGDIVRLNMVNATQNYAGQGNIFCKVVGRLGNTSGTDLTGDYLLMRVAG